MKLNREMQNIDKKPMEPTDSEDESLARFVCVSCLIPGKLNSLSSQ